MKNFKETGKMLRVPAAPTGGVTSGDLVAIGDLVGVAANTVAAGLVGHEVALIGVYAVKKQASLVINQGDKVYAAFTNTKADLVNTTLTSRVFVGWAYRPSTAQDTTVDLLLPLGGYSDI